MFLFRSISTPANLEKNKPHIEKWRNQGKRWLLCEHSVGDNVEALKKTTAEGVDGIIIDEAATFAGIATADAAVGVLVALQNNGSLVLDASAAMENRTIPAVSRPAAIVMLLMILATGAVVLSGRRPRTTGHR